MPLECGAFPPLSFVLLTECPVQEKKQQQKSKTKRKEKKAAEKRRTPKAG
jgi:hypothetical protein